MSSDAFQFIGQREVNPFTLVDEHPYSLDMRGEKMSNMVVKKEIDVATLENHCVDIILTVPQLPPLSPEECVAYMDELAKSKPDKQYWEAGGMCNIARLGLHCIAIGNVADEIHGHILLDVFREEGIDMAEISEHDHIVSSSTIAYKTFLCWILVDHLQQHYFICRTEFCKKPAVRMFKLPTEIRMVIKQSKILFYDGSLAWSTNTIGRSVAGLNLIESENLVLFNKTEDVVCQSFDHPTDSLVPGQILVTGQKLTTSVLETNSLDTSVAKVVQLMAHHKILSVPIMVVNASEDATWIDRYIGIIEFARIFVWILHQSEKKEESVGSKLDANGSKETVGPAAAPATTNGRSSPRYRSSKPFSVASTSGNFFESLTSSEFELKPKPPDALLKIKSVVCIITGSQALDEFLGGGIETNSLTEVFGEFIYGKTQLAHTLCVSTQILTNMKGGNGNAAYIDNDGTIRPYCIVLIAERYGMDAGAVLDNIIYARAYTYEHQYNLLLGLAAKIEDPGWYSRASNFVLDSVQDVEMNHNPKVETVIESGSALPETMTIPTENGNLFDTRDKDVYLEGLAIKWSSLRNGIDMSTDYGGIAAAIIDLPLWIMNVIPVHGPDTSIIFDRRLIGTYHPRSYDIWYANFLFGNFNQRCDILDVAVQMDRIPRPAVWKRSVKICLCGYNLFKLWRFVFDPGGIILLWQIWFLKELLLLQSYLVFSFSTRQPVMSLNSTFSHVAQFHLEGPHRIPCRGLHQGDFNILYQVASESILIGAAKSSAQGSASRVRSKGGTVWKMVGAQTSHGRGHPYVPRELNLPGFMPGFLSMSTIVGVYGGSSLLVVSLIWILSVNSVLEV